MTSEDKRYTRLRWQVFLSATVGYGIYYVCRLSLNVVKKPIVDSGTLTETELGIIGSALFITYAVGKFVNGFLADRVNVRRFMSLGLLADIPVDEVKIDKSLLDSYGNAESQSFLRDVIGLIHDVGKTAVCEGVETKEQYLLS